MGRQHMQPVFYNTRTRSKETFSPLAGNTVNMYCCGPTVYNYAHIGNLRTYIFEDILKRSLRFFGYGVRHVMNITDVGHLTDDGDDGEDKMIKGARERGMSVWDIAAMFTDAFFQDEGRLNIIRPDVVCRATEHIPDMIALVRTLEEKGFTYEAGGNIYFDVSKFEHYGDLALLDKQELRAGARIEVDVSKRNPRDFVLWFTKSKFDQQAMTWDSPWGRGYPGWHIECSAMSRKYLGDQFDIHCGGVDHIPVHHTNEIAQTEAASGKHPWVNFWLHAEFLLMNKTKMGKSSGTFLTLPALEKLGYAALDYRYFCLQANYRTQLSFSDEAMDAAKTGRANLNERVAKLLTLTGGQALSASAPVSFTEASATYSGASALALKDFADALADDLNMPRAFASVWTILKLDSVPAQERLELLSVFDQILGLNILTEAASSLKPKTDNTSDSERLEIEDLINQRLAARSAKDWSKSDAIRDELKARGIILKDSPAGTTWSRAPSS